MLSPRSPVAAPDTPATAPEDGLTDRRAGAPTAALAVSRIVLTDYRCYANLKLELDARPVVLTGPNGAGKTNLLEAISFLSPGRGLRRDRLAQVGRRGAAGPWSVAARLSTPTGIVEIGTGLAAPAEGSVAQGSAARGSVAQGSAAQGSAAQGSATERRVVKIDGRRAAGPAALAAVAAVAWLTPSMDRLFQEGASGRRRFLDRIVFGFEPEHARHAAAYERAMRQRGRLLKDRTGDHQWLAALEGAMAEHGVALAAARRHWLGRLAAALESASDRAAGPFPVPEVALALALGRQFTKIYIDISGLSGYRSLLDTIALLNAYATIFQPRAIVVKSGALKRFASNCIVWKSGSVSGQG